MIKGGGSGSQNFTDSQDSQVMKRPPEEKLQKDEQPKLAFIGQGEGGGVTALLSTAWLYFNFLSTIFI